MTAPTSAERERELPRWFEFTATVPGITLAVVGVVGLLLALLGVFTTWSTLALAAPIVTAAVVITGRPDQRKPASRSATTWAAATVLVAVGYAAFAGSVPSQNVRLSRDPGAYLNTGRWLAREGTLEVDAAGRAFEGIDGLRFDSAAVHSAGPGAVEFQFNHLTAVILAVGYDIGGHRLMLRMPAIATAAGLLAVYAVAARATRRPGPSLVAPTLLAVSLPVLFVSRNTYSEPFALLLLWTAVSLLAAVHTSVSRDKAVIGGAVLGALVCTRIDAALFGSILVALIGVSVSTTDRTGERTETGTTTNTDLRSARSHCWALAFGTFLALSSLAVMDVVVRAGHYTSTLRTQILLLGALLIGASIGALALIAVTARWPTLVQHLRAAHPIVAPVAAVVLAGVFIAGWLIRPIVQQVRTGAPMQAVDTQRAAALVAGLQRRTGLDVDPTRLYYENSLRWMGWYLGVPGLLAAIAGVGVTAWRTVRSIATPEAIATLAIAVAAGGLYLWNPSIYPDQLWASRRFVPAVMPAFAILASIALATIVVPAGQSRGGRVTTSLMVVAASIAIIGVAATATWPLRWQRAQSNYLAPVLELCSALGDRAAVLVLDKDAATVYPQTIRSWCGATVAIPTQPLDAATLATIAPRVNALGYRLHLVTTDRSMLTPFVTPAGPLPFATAAVSNRWQPESTLDRPPGSYLPEDPEDRQRFHILAVDKP